MMMNFFDKRHLRELQVEDFESQKHQNAERLMRTIKEEHVNVTEYVNYHNICQQLSRLLDDVYMNKSIHSSLSYLTPAEFESQWQALQRVVELTHLHQ